MKQTLAAILFFLIIHTNLLHAQEQVVLTDAHITFYVPAYTEDKDVNTQITATLYTAMGKKVAELEQCCGNIHYPATNYTSSTYQLAIRATAFKSEIQSGYFEVHIDPTVNDKWVFIPTLTISFSDGTKFTIKGTDEATPYTKREVSQVCPDTSFPFHL